MNIRRHAVYHDNGRLSRLSSPDAFFPVHRKIQFIAPSGEQTLIGEIRLHGGIHNRKLAIVVNLDVFLIKGHINDIIMLLVVA